MKEYVRLQEMTGQAASAGQLELASAYWALGRHEEAAETAAETWEGATRMSLVPLASRAWLTNFEMRADMARPGGANPDGKVIEELHEKILISTSWL